MKELKGIKWESILTQILIIVLGLILLFNPAATARTICYTIGMVIMAVGAVKVISYFLIGFNNQLQKNGFVTGVILIIIGILFVTQVNLIISIIPYFIGIIVVLSGLLKLQTVFELKHMKSNGWFGLLIAAVINIALGILLLSHLISAAKLMIRVCGICMIYSGITDLCKVIYVSKKMRDYIKDMQALEQDVED